MDNEGYPEAKELQLIKDWDYKDVFNLIEYLYERWHFGAWGFNQSWGRQSLTKKNVLNVHMSTGGWSGNESLIHALKENQFFCLLWHAQWNRGGHYKFCINPYNIGYITVSEHCKEYNVSRQYVHKTKDKFDWIVISQNKRLLRPK